MGNTNLKVDTNALNSDSIELLSEIRALIDQIEKMNDSVNDLNNMWKGKANLAFRSQFMKDYAEMKQFLEKLMQFAETLRDDSEEYAVCESKVISSVGKI